MYIMVSNCVDSQSYITNTTKFVGGNFDKFAIDEWLAIHQRLPLNVSLMKPIINLPKFCMCPFIKVFPIKHCGLWYACL